MAHSVFHYFPSFSGFFQAMDLVKPVRILNSVKSFFKTSSCVWIIDLESHPPTQMSYILNSFFKNFLKNRVHPKYSAR